jgi:hypothetical protein
VRGYRETAIRDDCSWVHHAVCARRLLPRRGVEISQQDRCSAICLECDGIRRQAVEVDVAARLIRQGARQGRRRTGNHNLRSRHHGAVAVGRQPRVHGGRRGAMMLNRVGLVVPAFRISGPKTHSFDLPPKSIPAHIHLSEFPPQEEASLARFEPSFEPSRLGGAVLGSSRTASPVSHETHDPLTKYVCPRAIDVDAQERSGWIVTISGEMKGKAVSGAARQPRLWSSPRSIAIQTFDPA